MITAGNPAPFVPFGRKFLKWSTDEISAAEQLPNFDETLSESAANSENYCPTTLQEKVKFRKVDRNSSAENYEEIYFRDNVVVLSKNGSILMKSFFVDFPVCDALWCDFPAEENSSTNKKLSTICIFGKQNLEVHKNEGERISLTLPFEVSHCFETQHGLLLQRCATISEKSATNTDDESSFPFLFSLSHPLNEVLPVLYKTIDKFGRVLPAKYTTNQSLKALYVDVNYSLLFTYDSKNNLHRLWSICKATHEDALSAARLLEQSVGSILNASLGKTPSIVRSNTTLLTQFRDTPSATNSSVSGVQQTSEQQYTSSTSNPSGTTAGTSSQSGILPYTLSPIFGASPFVTPNSSANLLPTDKTPLTIVNNKLNSPAVARLLGLIRQKTPSTLYSSPLPHLATPCRGTPAKNAKSRLLTPVLNSTTVPDIAAVTCSQYWPAEPLLPDVCLIHLWTENVASKRNESTNAAKIPAAKFFVSQDFVGQKFFCYFLTECQQLKCLKLKYEDAIVRVTHPFPEIIACKDVAIALNSTIVIVLETNFNVVLYSGITKICFLHVNTADLLFRNAALTTNDDQTEISPRIFSSSRAASLTSSPFKRSFVAATEVSLSPVVTSFATPDVQSTAEKATPIGFPTAAGFVDGLESFDASSTSFLMRLASRISCKVGLPPLCCNPSTQLCLDALCVVLPKEKSMDVCCQWYLTPYSPTAADVCTKFSFFIKFLADLLGFQTTKLNVFDFANNYHSTTLSHDLSTKKRKCAEKDGSLDDWEYVLRRPLLNEINATSNSSKKEGDSPREKLSRRVLPDGALFSLSPSVFWVLHCCYEELKLRRNCCLDDLKNLCKLLHLLAKALKLHSFADVYERDFSDLIAVLPDVYVEDGDFKKLQYPFYWNSCGWSIFKRLFDSFREDVDNESSSTPPPIYLPSSCVRLWIVNVSYGLLFGRIQCARDVDGLVKKIGGDLNERQNVILKFLDRVDLDVKEKLKEIFSSSSGNVDYGSLPCGVILPLLEIGELFTSSIVVENRLSTNGPPNESETASSPTTNDDGMNGLERTELLSTRFNDDLRIADVRRMLKSSRQVKIYAKQQSGTSDHDFREEQEHVLYSICLRTMMLPIGRGMFTFRSSEHVLTEQATIPKLCLTGKSSTQNLTIELTHIETPANMDLWPQFHNGVAAALRLKIASNSSWIVSSMMPKSTSSQTSVLQAENAGFLFGLGLNGHLSNLALFNIHEYLVKGDPMTSIAVLLGISASKCKTNDVMAMKMLATHVPFLLPPTLLELNVDPQIQNAAVVGVGLLCAESANHRLAEALLREIGRPPTAQTDNFVDRESYALSCGLALGLVTLGCGNLKFGDPDFTLADELILLMNGGHKRPHHLATNQTPSNVIKEGEFLNVHVTSAPATIALGMMYVRSNDSQAASWLVLPDTLALLDTVRPDCLLIRVVSRNLILWDGVLPTLDWVERQLPAVLHKYSSLIVDQDLPWYRDVDFETVAQSYCYVVAGACFSLALKFAGSANAEAFNVLIHYCKIFLSNANQRLSSIFGLLLQKAGKYTVETCLNVIVLSLGMVMASTGNLDVLRIVRRLRKRLVPGSNHLSPHMTLGLLFLGAGRYCLKTDNLAIAAMLCSFFPKFPTNSNDNRYHLQALRHLYVLACEPRVLVPKDAENNEIAYCKIRIHFKKTKNYPATSVVLKAPCPLPELNLLNELSVEDERYWPVKFEYSRNWADLEKIVSAGALSIRRRAGYDTYKEDPLGYKSSIHCNEFKMIGDWNVERGEYFNKFLSLQSFCVWHECLDALPFLIDLYERVSPSNLTTLGIWQLKLILAYAKNRKRLKKLHKTYRNVFPDEFVVALSLTLEENLITQVNASELKLYIGKWLDGAEAAGTKCLGEFLTFFDVAPRDTWAELQVRDYRHIRSFVEKMQSSSMPLNTVITLQKILTR